MDHIGGVCPDSVSGRRLGSLLALVGGRNVRVRIGRGRVIHLGTHLGGLAPGRRRMGPGTGGTTAAATHGTSTGGWGELPLGCECVFCLDVGRSPSFKILFNWKLLYGVW